MPLPSLDFQRLHSAYSSGGASVQSICEEILSLITERADDGVWIYRVPADEVLARARYLDDLPETQKSALALFGIPFSVKDCIDVTDMPTTAACPAYEYTAKHTNLAVQRALNAGAILIGKTNMDQFATGVVGVRSPYGVARNPFDADYIPGGSSSGAAVSVSSGLCGFAFGTDTGGSGRVPASYNNIVGLKPTLGLFSRSDMVNASKHFDTVSVYALTTGDALKVLETCQAVDPHDPYARPAPASGGKSANAGPLRIAVPQAADLEFFGNADAANLYAEGCDLLVKQGHRLIEFDFKVCAETSKMMFVGPWIAERYAAVGDFIEAHPDDIDASVKAVIMSACAYSAADAFKAIYRVQENAAAIRRIFDTTDIIAVPTVGTVYRVDDVRADPIATNATNGLYLNFASMADLAAIAVPNGFLPNGIPMGMTFVGPAFSDSFLARFGGAFHRLRANTLGATNSTFPSPS